MARKHRTISFDADQDSYDLWQQVKKCPQFRRGMHTKILSRMFSNIVSEMGNGGTPDFLGEDLKLELERNHERQLTMNDRRLKLLTQERIYFEAMRKVFEKTDIPYLYVTHVDDPNLPELMDTFAYLIRADTFRDSEYSLSPPMEMVKSFLNDMLEELEASGELNRLRCNEQVKEFEEFKKSNE